MGDHTLAVRLVHQRPSRPCRTTGCPKVVTGRSPWCPLHLPTNEERGYGREHRAMRRAMAQGARCATCGTTRHLHLDHIVPRSLGGTNDRANLRWLCRRHHAAFGTRVNANRSQT